MNWNDLRKWLLPALSTVVGGAGMYVATQFEDGVPQNAVQWKTIGIGALVAGLAALLPSPAFPGKPPPPPPEPEQRL